MRAVAALGLLLLASCADDAALSSLKGASVLFEATGRATNTYACDGARWQLRERGQEILFDGSGRRIATAVGDIYSTRWQGDDGSAVTVQVAARENVGMTGDPPALVYTAVGRQGSGRFSSVTTVRRGPPRGVGISTRSCRDLGEERKVEYSATYTFYGGSASR
jgi:hypothetical protein